MKAFKFLIDKERRYPPPTNPNPFFREGWDAYFNAEPSQSNPHTTGNTISLWIQGWVAAREFIRELNEGWLE
jgi:ribosome modulation factor